MPVKGRYRDTLPPRGQARASASEPETCAHAMDEPQSSRRTLTSRLLCPADASKGHLDLVPGGRPQRRDGDGRIPDEKAEVADGRAA